jgi:hypothetical protein
VSSRARNTSSTSGSTPRVRKEAIDRTVAGTQDVQERLHRRRRATQQPRRCVRHPLRHVRVVRLGPGDRRLERTLGQVIVGDDRVVRYSESAQHQRGEDSRPVLARGAVEHDRVLALGDDAERRGDGVLPHRREDGVVLAVRRRRIVALDRLERDVVPFEHREVEERDVVSSIEATLLRELRRRPQIDDGPQPQVHRGLEVCRRQAMQAIGTEDRAPAHRSTAGGLVPADVPKVEARLERNVPLSIRHTPIVRTTTASGSRFRPPEVRLARRSRHDREICRRKRLG